MSKTPLEIMFENMRMGRKALLIDMPEDKIEEVREAIIQHVGKYPMGYGEFGATILDAFGIPFCDICDGENEFAVAVERVKMYNLCTQCSDNREAYEL